MESLLQVWGEARRKLAVVGKNMAEGRRIGWQEQLINIQGCL